MLIQQILLKVEKEKRMELRLTSKITKKKWGKNIQIILNKPIEKPTLRKTKKSSKILTVKIVESLNFLIGPNPSLKN